MQSYPPSWWGTKIRRGCLILFAVTFSVGSAAARRLGVAVPKRGPTAPAPLSAESSAARKPRPDRVQRLELTSESPREVIRGCANDTLPSQSVAGILL